MTDIALPDSETFKRFLAAAEGGEVDTNPEQTMVDIVAKILDAKDVAGVLEEQSVIHGVDFVDQPFLLTGVKFNKSDFDSAAGNFYAVLSGADKDGEVITVTSGAKRIIAQSWKLADMQALPISVVIRKAKKPTAEGYYVMWLEAGPASF